jgi:hypothetical protein
MPLASAKDDQKDLERLSFFLILQIFLRVCLLNFDWLKSFKLR